MRQVLQALLEPFIVINGMEVMLLVQVIFICLLLAKGNKNMGEDEIYTLLKWTNYLEAKGGNSARTGESSGPFHLTQK